MMFRSRQQASKCLILTAGSTNNSNRRNFLFMKQQQQQYHHQTKLLLLACYANSSKKGVGSGDCNKKTMLPLLSEQKKRFFALDAFFSSSSGQQKQEQQTADDEKGFPGEEQQQKSPVQTHRDLAKKWLQLDAASRLQLTLGQGKSGWKFFGISKSFEHRRTNSNKIIIGNRDFPNLTLELGYPLVNAMDTLLNSLLAKHNGEEVNNQSFDDEHQHKPGHSPLALESQRVNGPYFDLQLELVQLGGNTNDSDVYQFNMKTIKTVQEHREQELSMPVQALPWLRHEMAQMLAEHDGSQQLGPAPPELPESILQAQPAAVHNQRQQEQPQQQQQQFASHQQPLSIQQALKKALLPDDSSSPFSSTQLQHGQQQHSHGQPASIQQALKKALLPDDLSSSSSPFSSSQQHEQQQYKNGENIAAAAGIKPYLKLLDKKVFQLLDSGEILHLEFVHAKTGRKFFKVANEFKDETREKRWISFVPKEARQMVNAMDALLNTLKKHKAKQSAGMSSNSSGESSPIVEVLGSQRISADHYDIRLELVRHDNLQVYEFKLNTLKTVDERHKERELRFPVRALPLLRHTLAQMLAEHDEEEEERSSQQQQFRPAPPEPTAVHNQRQQQQQQFASHQQPLSIQQALKKALLPD